MIQSICKKMLFPIILFAGGWPIRMIQSICKKMLCPIISFGRCWPIRIFQSIGKKDGVSDYPLCKGLAPLDDPNHLQKKHNNYDLKQHHHKSKCLTTIILTGRNITASSKPTRTPHPIELSSPFVHINHQHDHIRDRSI